MSTIKEAALNYQSKQTRNLAELAQVATDVQIYEGKAAEGTDKEFTYKYISINGEEFRVPDKVLKDLNAILAKKPTLKTFSVTKAGEGFKTQYTVIPMD